jgi:hypothetical protein
VTPDLPTLKSLLARVEGATGADRELDGDLWWTLDHGRAERVFSTGALGLPRRYPATLPIPGGLGRAGVQAMAPEFTASLDAALALCERVLPGCGIDIGLYPAEPPGRPTPLAEATMRACDSGHPFVAVRPCFAPTAALALLAALLKALISQE